jgi:ABC-type glycerol-3-phosphate transport system permease component
MMFHIDDAGHWQMLTQIMLPLARPSISTIAIFDFMWVWNDFIYPLVYMQDEEK